MRSDRSRARFDRPGAPSDGLETRSDRRAAKRRLEFAVGQHFERRRVQILEKILSLFHVVRPFRKEETIVKPYLGIKRMLR